MRENIVFAGKSMIPKLTSLWMEAFGDEREYIEFYFKNRFREDNLLVYLKEGVPVSMISLLPLTLHSGKEAYKARYVYAVATKTEHRGRGYAKELILAAREQLKEPLLLEPADKGLAEYYRRMGFRDAFSLQEYNLWEKVSKEQVTEAAEGNVRKEQRYWLLTITPTEYATLRNQYLQKDGYAEWDKAAINYALMENEYWGGYAYKVFHHEKEDILLYRMDGDEMHILETTLTDEDICGVLEKLRISPEVVKVRRPIVDGGEADSKRAFGMVLGEINISDGYLNLTLE